MENPNQRFAQGRDASPASQTRGHGDTASELDPGRQGLCRHEYPADERYRRDGEHGPIETVERCRCRGAWVLSHEPVSRETGDDAAADDADQHQERGDPEPIADRAGRGNADSFEMNEQISHEQERKRDQHGQIAPIAPRHDLSSHYAQEHEGKCEIHQRRCVCADRRREQHRDTSSDPKQGQDGERSALKRHAASPIWDSRQEKPGDGGRAVSVNHLVHVPDDGRQGTRKLALSGIKGEPKRDADGCPERGKQEKRAESGRKQDGAALRAITRNSVHEILPDPR